MSMWAGVLFGLGAASAQSVSYLFSRVFTSKRGRLAPLRLWTMSHVMQGAVCLPLAWLLWPGEMGWDWAVFRAVAGAGGFYAVGQLGLFVALGYTDASRVSALLGLKIPFVAVLALVVLGRGVSMLEWAAVGLAVLAAFVLNYSGGSLRGRAVVAVLFTCMGYALSDVSIGKMVEALGPYELAMPGAFGAALTYVLCGGLSLLALPWLGSRDVGEWRGAAPYAMSWLAGMLLLFSCFAVVGVVYGNILQATRGLISIGLGALLAQQGMVHLESKISRGVFARRFAAAGLMILAIGIFVMQRR